MLWRSQKVRASFVAWIKLLEKKTLIFIWNTGREWKTDANKEVRLIGPVQLQHPVWTGVELGFRG